MSAKHVDFNYQYILQQVSTHGEDRGDRTGTGARSLFHQAYTVNLADGFPLIALKKTNWKAAFIEQLWFLSGKCDNLATLHEQDVHIWDDWADKEGNLGPIYGVQLRKWAKTTVVDEGDVINHMDGSVTYLNSKTKTIYIDQVKELLHNLKTAPTGRRHILSSWNVSDLPEMALPPCHYMTQWYVSNLKAEQPTLSAKLFLRSNDLPLGHPFNVVQYALLVHIFANILDYKVGSLIIDIGDSHIYANQLETINNVVLTRSLNDIPAENNPQLVIKRKLTDIDDISIDDFDIVNYHPLPFVKFPIAV